MICLHLLILLSSFASCLFHVLDPAVEYYRSPVTGEVFSVMVHSNDLIKESKAVITIFDGLNMHTLTMAIEPMNAYKKLPAPEQKGSVKRKPKKWLNDVKVTVMQAEVFVG